MTITEPSGSAVPQSAPAELRAPAPPARAEAPRIPPSAGAHAEPNSSDPPWTTRKRLAYGVLGLLAVLVFAAVAAMFSDVDLQRVKDVMAIVFGPVAGLVGAVVGFYFGARTGSESPRNAIADGAPHAGKGK